MLTEVQLGYVFSYINPDSDGICSSIGYEFYSKKMKRIFKAIIFGNINNETKFIFKNLDLKIPESNPIIEPSRKIVIVDTHDKNQLPSQINLENVIEIIDHHPYGNTSDFPRAKIQIEKVGAVATLITEKIKNSNLKPTEKIAGALIYAIISNTLNFVAPSATPRDRIAYEWLSQFKSINQKNIKKMFEEKSYIEDKTTIEVLKLDYKEYIFSNKKIGISQFETVNPNTLIERQDIKDAFSTIINTYKLDYFFVNIIDIIGNNSIIITFDTDTKKMLEKAIGASFNGHESIFQKVLLRKTDLIPSIEKLL